jgi:hypothetical protein
MDIDLLLNCNKIKALGTTKQAIADAIKTSQLVELNSDSTKVRRKDNKPLPELKLLSKKRKADSDVNLDKDEDNKLDP